MWHVVECLANIFLMLCAPSKIQANRQSKASLTDWIFSHWLVALRRGIWDFLKNHLPHIRFLLLSIRCQKMLTLTRKIIQRLFWSIKAVWLLSCNKFKNIENISGPSQAGGPGGHVPPPHFLADQLTLSQPRGAHLVLRAPPRFSDLATALRYEKPPGTS